MCVIYRSESKDNRDNCVHVIWKRSVDSRVLELLRTDFEFRLKELRGWALAQQARVERKEKLEEDENVAYVRVDLVSDEPVRESDGEDEQSCARKEQDDAPADVMRDAGAENAEQSPQDPSESSLSQRTSQRTKDDIRVSLSSNGTPNGRRTIVKTRWNS